MKTIKINLITMSLIMCIGLCTYSQTIYVSEEETIVPIVLVNGSATDYADEGRVVAIWTDVTIGEDYIEVSPETVTAAGPACPTYDEDGRHPPEPPDPTEVTADGSITLIKLPAPGTTVDFKIEAKDDGYWTTCSTGETHGWDGVEINGEIICVDVLIGGVSIDIDEETGLITICCTAEGYTGGGQYTWSIGNKTAVGKEVTVTFECCEWNFKEGQEIPINVKYSEGGASAYDDHISKIDPIPFEVKIIEASATTSKKTGEVKVKCIAEGTPIGGEYNWGINGKSVDGKNVTVTFKKEEWDIKDGETMPVKVTYSLCGEKTNDDTEINVPPILTVEILEAKGRRTSKSEKVTIDCLAEGLPEGGVYKWNIGNKVKSGKKVHIVLDKCEWDAHTGIIPIKVKYTVAGKSVTAETTVKVKPLKFFIRMKPTININPKRKHRLTAIFRPKSGKVTWAIFGGCITKNGVTNHPGKSHLSFKAKKPGTANINATLSYCGEVIDVITCKVTVK